VSLIFVALLPYEDIFTTKFSQITVPVYCSILSGTRYMTSFG